MKPIQSNSYANQYPSIQNQTTKQIFTDPLNQFSNFPPIQTQHKISKQITNQTKTLYFEGGFQREVSV